MITLQYRLLLLIALFVAAASVGAAEVTPALEDDKALHHKQLRFVVYHPHFPPYIFSNLTDNSVTGILPDLLAPFFAAQGIELVYVFDNRSGAEQRLYKGEVDAMMLNPAWAKQPQQLVFSDAVVPYYDYLFARSAQQVVQSASELQDKKICTREYYVYPELVQGFNQGELVRVDSSSQEAQLRMVFNKRCDLVYINDLIVHWLLQHEFGGRKLYRIDVAKASSELRIALHPSWQPLLPQLNAYIRQQQQAGEIQRIISRYVEPTQGYSK